MDFFLDEDVLFFEGNEIEVIHTPGHSAGHCCFLINGDILFTGDIDLNFPWYGCIDSNLRDFLNSIDLLKKISPKIAVPGHGKVVDGEDFETKLERYKSIILERDRKIREALTLGEDPVGKGIIYRRFPDPKEIYEFFERIMVEKHLEMH